MYADLNGVTVLSARILLPRVGAWHADLVVEGDAPPTGDLTLTLGPEGAQTKFLGTAFRDGGYAGMSYVRMVAGKCKLATVLDARQYKSVPARVVLSQAVEEAGEVVASSVDADLLGTTLDVWMRTNDSAGLAISELADLLGAGWRVLIDGTVWFGAETWPDAGLVASDYLRTDLGPSEGYAQIASEKPILLPGTTFEGRKVSEVRHEMGSGSIRTEMWFEGTG